MVTIKVPQFIKVGGHTFEIVLVENMEDDGHRARVNYRTMEIEINPDRPPTVKAQGFFHECGHLIDTIYLNRRIDNEDIIEPMAEGFWQVIEQLGCKFDWSGLRVKE